MKASQPFSRATLLLSYPPPASRGGKERYKSRAALAYRESMRQASSGLLAAWQRHTSVTDRLRHIQPPRHASWQLRESQRSAAAAKKPSRPLSRPTMMLYCVLLYKHIAEKTLLRVQALIAKPRRRALMMAHEC